jgi:hypothetical protein
MSRLQKRSEIQVFLPLYKWAVRVHRRLGVEFRGTGTRPSAEPTAAYLPHSKALWL